MRPILALVPALLMIVAVSPAAALDAAPHLHPLRQGTAEVAFAPWDDTEGAVLRVVREARRAVFVQAFLFTSRALARELIAARDRGLRVEVLADVEMNTKGGSSQIPALAEAGIPVALETRYASAHNKVIIADPDTPQATVLTGSYNFTWSAKTQNAENLLIVRGNPGLARAYFANWRRHRAQAQEFFDRR